MVAKQGAEKAARESGRRGARADSGRWRRRRRRAALVLVALIVAASLALPLLREQLRRGLEARLGAALGGRVSLRSVERLRPSSLELCDLRAPETTRLPFLSGLRLERARVRVEGGLWRFASTSVDLRLEGLTLLVTEEAAAERPPASATEGLRWPAARVEVLDSLVRFTAASGEAELRLRGALRTEAGGPEGLLRFAAKRLPVAPVAAAAPLPEWLAPVEEGLSVRDLTGVVRLERDRVFVEASAPAGRWAGEPEDLELGAVAGSAELSFQGLGGISFSVEAPWMQGLTGRIERAPGSGWRASALRVTRADAALLRRLHPGLARWSIRGEGDLRLVPTDTGGPVVLAGELRLEEADAEAGGGRWSLRDVRLAADLVLAEPRRVERAVAALGGWRWESEAFGTIHGVGWSGSADGRLAEDGSSTWSGLRAVGESAALATRDGLRVDASAFELTSPEAWLAEPANARLRFPDMETSTRRLRVVERAARVHELSEVRGRGSAELPLDSVDGPLLGEWTATASAYAPRVGDVKPPAAELRASTWRLSRAEAGAPLALVMSAELGRDWGLVRAKGDVLPEFDLQWSWRSASPARFLEDWVGDPAAPLSLASLSASGTLDGEGLRARATATDWRYRLGESSWSGGERLPLTMRRRPGEAAVHFEVPSTPAGLWLPGRGEAVPFEASAAGSWRLEGDLRGPIVDELAVRAGGLGGLAGRADLAAGTGRVDWTGGDLQDWTLLLLTEPPGWWPERVEGELSGPLSWIRQPDGVVELKGDVALRGAGFESADGERVVLGATAGFAATGRWDPEARRLALAAGSEDFGGFEWLWGSLYGDWSQQRTRLALRMETAPGLAGVALAGFDLQPDPAARVELVLQPLAEGWSLSAELPSLERTWPRWLGDRLDGTGLLEELELSGALLAELEGRVGSAGSRIEGSIRLHGVSAALPGLGAAVEGLDLDWPVDVSRETSGSSWAGPLRVGRLAVRAVRLGGLRADPLEARLDLRGDSVAIAGALVVPLFGGRADLEDLQATRLLSTEPRVAGRLRLRGVDLDRLSAELALPPAEGRLDADFGQAVLTPSRLQLSGVAEAELFGGRVELVGLSVRDPLGPLPETSAQLVVEGLDLERLTARVGFGRITGRLDGRVDGLVLQGRTPVRFDARFRTVPRAGVPQVISVEAAEDITALGSGGSGEVFDRGWLRFFHRYEYDRAGFEAVLNHGVIRLSGTERRGDRQLFVKGAFPLRLDVVNADPARVLSYQGLVDRVKNLGLEGVRIQRGRPAAAGGSER